ncbi:MAG: citrate synthase/methylcitrate synthase [Coxiella sp. (in: Bacteria)]|nr:MAG: citrate synthase/methylcitrate synthase [Coxiella sp. (in: g-proteobacteria)]
MAELHIGLEGIAVAETAISDVRGAVGQLVYRGHWVQDLVGKHSYEAVVYLLWNGDLPNEQEEAEFTKYLAGMRELLPYQKQLIELLPKDLTPMEVIRTVVSSIHPQGEPYPPTAEQAADILAKAPVIVAHHYNFHEGKECVAPDATLGHAANYLYMLHHKVPNEGITKALEAYLILSADHGTNASTFTARVVTGTNSDMVSAITAAIGALIGPLHGGAPSHVDDMLDEIGTEDNIDNWIRNKLDNNERLMGFGHRVYKTYDPRAAALRSMVKQFAAENHLFKLSLQVEKRAVKLLEEYKPGRDLYPNLEFWAAGVLRTVKLPRTLYTSTFCIARIAGWAANILEQANNNRLIRPSCIYTGPEPKGEAPGLPNLDD